ncbi:prophage DNA circulation protein [Humitalea rosea]|uniref:Prophage DNA circulation protein n=1 Tax=Humitalea rosea TaxID=990373 RepID=A0A2W7KGI3_9PROT|nr:DNA circularization N-terminal domain-containing protein [Humitalea rosea]PZW46849.1 prophage DNA circulation protein [Humitalea rosea]
MSGFLAGVIGTGAVGGGFLERALRPASLRGEGFWVSDGEDTTARRWITHEFPLRDEPWHEDLGPRVQTFGVDGVLIGDDVVAQAEAFRTAAGAAGPARLVHPWYGEMDVVVLDLRVRLSANEGRIARISFKVERFGSRPLPIIAVDGIGAVLGWINDAVATVRDAVGRLRSLVGAVDGVIGTVLGLAGGLVSAATSILFGAGLSGALAGTATARALAALAGLTATEARDTATVSARIADVPRAIAHEAGGGAAIAGEDPPAVPAPGPVTEALLRLATGTAIPVPTARATPTQIQTANTAQALSVVLRVTAAAEAARAATEIAWTSSAEAVAMRDRLADVLEAAAEAAAAIGLDDTWRGTLDLRAAVIADLNARAASLPDLVTIILPAPLPASLVAYRLDGDALGTVFARGEDLVARNRVRHPGFVPAGVPLEAVRG